MAPTQDDYNRLLTNSIGKVYTFMEACDFMKILDTFPTGNNTISWINARTKQPVAIGYNPKPKTIKKKEDKKTKNDKVKYYDSYTGKPKYK